MAYYAGDLRTPITVRKRVEGEVDQYGRRSVTWKDHVILYAKVSNVSGREYFEAAAYQLENTVTFTTRYLASVNNTMRVRFDGQDYEIKEVNHLGYLNDFMQLKCSRIEAEGGSYNA